MRSAIECVVTRRRDSVYLAKSWRLDGPPAQITEPITCGWFLCVGINTLPLEATLRFAPTRQGIQWGEAPYASTAWCPTRHGIPHSMAAHAAWYPTLHDISHGMESHAVDGRTAQHW